MFSLFACDYLSLMISDEHTKKTLILPVQNRERHPDMIILRKIAAKFGYGSGFELGNAAVVSNTV